MTAEAALVLALDCLAHEFAMLNAQEGTGDTQQHEDEAQGVHAPSDAPAGHGGRESLGIRRGGDRAGVELSLGPGTPRVRRGGF